ncbi:hypothetical protein I4U23_025549 [Adineta vaga]|nr:hypothetical protein I4U23_025549 [Adineta vaga]
MNDSVRDKYPSAAVRQHQTKIAFLIDCDAGLGTAFHSKKPKLIKPDLTKDFPPNSDIFLFFNRHDDHMVKRLEDLKDHNPNVHVFPTLTYNSRNGADMNLSFMLGLISDKYDSYVLVTRGDRAYEEVKQRLEYAYPQLKGHVDLQLFNSPKEMAEYIRKVYERQPELTNVTKLKVNDNQPKDVKFTLDNIFEPCPDKSCRQSTCLYRCRNLLIHLNDNHPNIRYQYCSKCEEMIGKNNPNENRLYAEHVQKEHVENNAGFCISIEAN